MLDDQVLQDDGQQLLGLLAIDVLVVGGLDHVVDVQAELGDFVRIGGLVVDDLTAVVEVVH